MNALYPVLKLYPSRKYFYHAREAAFSLVESLICLSILSIVFYFGIPSLSQLSNNNQLAVIKQDLTNAIRFAKTQAVAENQPLLLRPLAAGDWSQGVVVMTEHLKTIQEWHWEGMAVHVVWHGFQSSYLRFSPNINQNTLNGFFLMNNQGNQQIKLIVNRIGRVRMEKSIV